MTRATDATSAEALQETGCRDKLLGNRVPSAAALPGWFGLKINT
jgi:hypothetical protein